MGEETSFRAGWIHLTPVIFTLLATSIFTLIVMKSQVKLVAITTFPEKDLGPVMNAALFISTTAIVAIFIYFLVKRRLWSLLRLVVGIAFASVTFMLTFLYEVMLTPILGINPNEVGIITFLLAVVLTLVSMYSVFMLKGPTQTVTTLIIGAAIGTFLGASVPTLSAIFLLLFLAIYDVIAVYRGPIGKIASEADPDRLRGLSFTFKEIQVGVGDLVFYSMLVAHVSLYYAPQSGFFAAIGVLIGVYGGLKVLEKRTMFPGLPMALIFGLTLAFASLYLF